MTIDEVGQKTLEQIADDIAHPLSRWRSNCGLVAPAIARKYELDVQLLQLGNDGSGDQQYHLMLIASDGRVLDALECQARRGLDPTECADSLPFTGTRAEWGRARGFDAETGSAVSVPPLPSWL